MSRYITKEDFRNAEAIFGTLEGNEHLGECISIEVPDSQRILIHGIMMCGAEHDDIKQCVKDLCERYQPQRVLEVGFGLGFTATQFQECGIQKHVIVEAHPQMAEKAREWREEHPTKDIEIIEEFFQDYQYNEKDYDLIYDDRFEMINREREYRDHLLEQGFTFVAPPIPFPCWKVIVDRGNEE